ncbi:NAD(P)-binding protein [Aspergillus violaceofuscus CBS 115571]|uniref:NAD(P)-binding protein n=1 Tax=Aspergillus violaceofuscus (strain CBS 115571) TaxID=1450538 RepID=A0A2V5HS35_ASPV1|nr:NAD(P)-binding protein [Aspergillus violaceofuscus CBS 115571]
MGLHKQTRFITGCSSGFGEQFGRQLRALGDNVVATGRNADTKLAHLKDTGATILDLDVTAPQADLNAKFQQAIDRYGGSGFYEEPGAAAYCASKFALEGAVESLAKELAWLAPGIKPLIIEAGIFSTEVMNNINHFPTASSSGDR